MNHNHRTSTFSRSRDMSIIVACAIIHRDGHKCVYCMNDVLIKTNDPFVRAELDHIKPRVEGGAAVPTNLVTTCRKCNMARHWGKLEHRKILDAIAAAHKPIDLAIGRLLAMTHYPTRVKPLKRGVEAVA